MTYVFDDTRALARRLADAGFGGHAEQLLAATSQGAHWNGNLYDLALTSVQRD